MGGPIDFPNGDGAAYADDNQLPAVNIYTSYLGNNSAVELQVGFADAKAGIA